MSVVEGRTEREASRKSVSAGGWQGPLVSGNATLHHLGFVVASISAAAEDFALSISARWNGEIIHDPIQRVRVAFFYPSNTGNPVYELVEPASEISPVSTFVKNKRGGLHHVCYEIDNVESVIEVAHSAGWTIISPPVSAVAFQGRRIAWICSRRRLLVELLERKQRVEL